MVAENVLEGRPFHVRAYGPLALFTRPEFAAERVSYDVITPSAARGILDSVLWKPGMRWVIKAVTVLAPLRTVSVRRNEVSVKGPSLRTVQRPSVSPLDLDRPAVRIQRNSVLLIQPDYVIEASIRMTDPGSGLNDLRKREAMFTRRLARGQVFRRPFFGCREFAAEVEPATGSERPAAEFEGRRVELGRMLFDLFPAGSGRKAVFFDAVLENGLLRVPTPEEVLG